MGEDAVNYRRVGDESDEHEVAWHLLEGLALHGSLPAVFAARRLLDHDNPRIRTGAGLVLLHHGTAEEGPGARAVVEELTRADGALGSNFLSDKIHMVALERFKKNVGTVEDYRLFHDMLSSMPMCFNLFGELAADLELARRLLERFAGLDVAEVIAV